MRYVTLSHLFTHTFNGLAAFYFFFRSSRVFRHGRVFQLFHIGIRQLFAPFRHFLEVVSSPYAINGFLALSPHFMHRAYLIAGTSSLFHKANI